jgi:hypothetical protein
LSEAVADRDEPEPASASVGELVEFESRPSVQATIGRDGAVEVLSTHEQELDGQRYVGCRLPAADTGIVEAAEHVGRVLAADGAVGRFAIDCRAG